jgi:hypothetical protein
LQLEFSKGKVMKFGICCGPTSLAQDGEDISSSVARLMTFMKEAGADYVEFGVGATLPEGNEAGLGSVAERGIKSIDARGSL